MTAEKEEYLCKALQRRGASYEKAKELVKSFINGDAENFKILGGVISEVYHPSEDRWTTKYIYQGYSLLKGSRSFLIKKLRKAV